MTIILMQVYSQYTVEFAVVNNDTKNKMLSCIRNLGNKIQQNILLESVFLANNATKRRQENIKLRYPTSLNKWEKGRDLTQSYDKHP